MADVVQLARPPAGGPGSPRRPGARAVFEPTDIEAAPQNTIALAADQALVFIRPRIYGQPSFMSSVMNLGPGAVSVRWDGVNTTYGDPAAILLPAGTGYAELTTLRLAVAADATGATISLTCEAFHG
jgi:hypothetical protein